MTIAQTKSITARAKRSNADSSKVHHGAAKNVTASVADHLKTRLVASCGWPNESSVPERARAAKR